MNRSRLLAAFFSLALLAAAAPLTGCGESHMMAYRPAPQASKASASFAPAYESAAAREVVRNGQVTLEVSDAEKARAQIEEKAEALGGYVERNEATRMVVKVPGARMQEAAKALSEIGRVIGGGWQAQDVTEAGDGARARVKALQAEVERLKALLAGAKDGEAQARLNAQLQAAQLQLAALVDEMRVHDTQVAMATLDIRLTLDPALAGLNNAIPVAWVRQLGQVVAQSRAVNLEGIEDYASIWYSPSVAADFPAGFVQFKDANHTREAVDANSTHLRISRHDNSGGAGSSFWFPLVRRGVAESGGLNVVEEKDLNAARQQAARLVVAERAVGGQKLAYAVAAAASRDYVYTVEMWGTKEEVAKLRPAFEACVGTLRVK